MERFIRSCKYVTYTWLLDSTHAVHAKKAFSFVAEPNSLPLRKWINEGIGQGVQAWMDACVRKKLSTIGVCFLFYASKSPLEIFMALNRNEESWYTI